MKTKEEIGQAIAPIEGWCTADKAYKIYSLIEQLRPTKTLEAGIYQGKSLAAFVAGHREFGGEVTGIDPYTSYIENGVKRDKAYNGEPWTSIYYKVVKRFESYPCQVLRMTIQELAQVTKDKFGIIHIDGNHAEHAAYEDIKTALTLLEPNGFLIVDDTDWPSVQAALRKFDLQLIDEHSTGKVGSGDSWQIYKTK